MNSINRVLQADTSLVDGKSQGFKVLVDSLIYCLQDENTETSELSRELLRDLIKNYKKFPEVIPRLSFVNRQDLLYVIGQTDVLFRSTLNFSNYNSIRSQTICRQTNLTVGSDRYKSENLSTQVPDNTSYKIKGTINETGPIKAKSNSKTCFGVIPKKFIKGLESNNSYEDRSQILTRISEEYIKDKTNFSLLSKKLNEFLAYIFGLSHEDVGAEDESIAYECLSLIHEILEKDPKTLFKLKYKLIFSNLIDHFGTSDISLLNEVIQIFKQIIKL